MPIQLPSSTTAASTLEFEKLPDGRVRASLTTKRNDPRLNSHNCLMIQHWRANVDLQIIVDVDTCASMPRKVNPDLELCPPSSSLP